MRKAIDRQRLYEASAEVQGIKCANLVSNRGCLVKRMQQLVGVLKVLMASSSRSERGGPSSMQIILHEKQNGVLDLVVVNRSQFELLCVRFEVPLIFVMHF